MSPGFNAPEILFQTFLNQGHYTWLKDILSIRHLILMTIDPGTDRFGTSHYPIHKVE